MQLKSNAYSLNIKDFVKGALLAVIVPALLAIQQQLQNPPINWKAIGIAAIATFIGYLLKNFLTDGVAEAQGTIADAQQNAINENN